MASQGKVPTALLVRIDSNLVQYEWVAADDKWVKFFDNDPEPPADLPPGKFDGQIIDVEK